MVFKERRGGDTVDIKKEIDKPYEGVYLGYKGIITKLGDQKIYRFKGDKGRVVEIYGFTMLNRAMDNVMTGEKCRITYQGTQNMDTKFGKKDVHQVLVEVDDEYTEEVDDEDAPF